jgi:hypothetical protein
MELLNYLIGFVIGCFLGYNYFAFKVYRQLIKLAEKEGINLEENKVVTPDIRMLKVETHNNVFYTYDIKSNDFMAQGSSLDEVAENLFKNKNVNFALLAAPDNKIIKIINGKIQ